MKKKDVSLKYQFSSDWEPLQNILYKDDAYGNWLRISFLFIKKSKSNQKTIYIFSSTNNIIYGVHFYFYWNTDGKKTLALRGVADS